MTCDMYQLVDGTAGESTDKNHSGYSDIVSLSWGASQHSSMQSGGGGGAGKVSFSDLTVTAEMDKATPTLLKFCASGKHIASVKLSICRHRQRDDSCQLFLSGIQGGTTLLGARKRRHQRSRNPNGLGHQAKRRNLRSGLRLSRFFVPGVQERRRLLGRRFSILKSDLPPEGACHVKPPGRAST